MVVRVAFADPPYVGQAAKHYRHHPDYAGEVDHAVLIARLVQDYPDGWALSASSPSLRIILPMCPADVRVAAIAAGLAWDEAMKRWKQAQEAVQERRTRQTLQARREAAAVLDRTRREYLRVTGQEREERDD